MKSIASFLISAAVLVACSTAFAGDRPKHKKDGKKPIPGRVEPSPRPVHPANPQADKGPRPAERIPGADMREQIIERIMSRLREAQSQRGERGGVRSGRGRRGERQGPAMSMPGRQHRGSMRGGREGRPGMPRGLERFRQARERKGRHGDVRGQRGQRGPDSKGPQRPGAPAIEMLKKAVRSGNAEAARNIAARFRSANPEAFKRFVSELRGKNPEAFKAFSKLLSPGKKPALKDGKGRDGKPRKDPKEGKERPPARKGRKGK